MTGTPRHTLLLCRSREAGDAVEQAFADSDWELTDFPTTRTNALDPADPAIANAVRGAASFDLILFSSPHGVTAFAEAARYLRAALSGGTAVGVVGRRVEAALADHLPQTEIRFRGGSLGDLLAAIAAQRGGARLLHVTSRQSLRHIAVAVPASLDLIQVPFYETITDDRHTAAELADFRERRFDAVLTGSPSAFAGLLDLVGADAPLLESPLAVLGESTRDVITARGYDVAIVADTPSAEGLRRALDRHVAAHSHG